MQRLWSADELGERWTLLPGDLALLTDLPDTGRLGLAAQLAYWRQQGCFPDDEADLAPAVVGHLAAQEASERTRSTATIGQAAPVAGIAVRSLVISRSSASTVQPKPRSAAGARRSCCRASRDRRSWRRRSAAGLRAGGSPVPARTGSTVSSAPPTPRTTMRRCSA